MLTEGMTIADRYEIIEKIGTGGMSDVYKAMDHLLGRNVAVKILKTEFSEDANFLAKFRSEAQAAAGLEHPNIVNIYDVGSENKMHYIVMEYVEGVTLKTYIASKYRMNLNIGYKEAISIAIQTANGIRAAHNKKIVHRDIKPQNIIISTEGKVKVTDFGIARATTSNTINSDVMGSVHYTSPEQARNGYVDFKSDIYSLGIVMYEMCTGRVPFNGDSAVAVALQHLQEEMVLPSVYNPEIPISLEKIILKCTQKSPDRRYQTVDDLIVDLKKAMINPNEDFVVLESVPLQDSTRVISRDEVAEINNAVRKEYEKSVEQAAKNEGDFNEDNLLEETDEDDDNDKPLLNPKMEKAVTIMGIIAAIFMVVVIVLIAGTLLNWFHFGSGKDDAAQEEDANKVEMINVTGMTFEEAQKALNELNLGIQLEGTENSSEFEEGQIIYQSVKKGDMVDKNSTIKVTICAGSEKFTLDDVSGMDEAQATEKLQGEPNFLVVSVTYEYSDSVEAEKVIGTNPAAGTEVSAGDVVTLIVSRGSEGVEVPDVVGKTESVAKKALQKAGFSVTVSNSYSDSVPAGKVISQSVSGGKTAASGSTIKITVSSGPETTYYSYSTSISKALDVDKGGVAYTVTSAVITLTVDGNVVYETTTSAFPKTISASNLTASSGTLKITWTYVNTDDSSDTYTEVETSTVNFKKSN